MDKRKIIVILLPILAVLLFFGAAAADYSFKIPKAQTTLEIESDGSMTIFVEYEIENLGQKLDYIDIGLPSNNYALKDIVVKLNNQESMSIKVTKADYEETGLRYGISLEMGSKSLRSGETATVSVTIPNFRKNLYEADAEKADDSGNEVEMVGFQFSPNYFNRKFIIGNTEYSFVIVFPPGVGDGAAFFYTPEKWPGDEKPEAWLDEDGCVVYDWYSDQANMYTAYTFGGKFVRSVLTTDSNINKSISSSSGTVVSGSSDSFLGIAWDTLLTGLGCIGVPGLMIFGFVRLIKANKKEKIKNAGKYYPPQVKTDGEGIKRGLTAVEAAVLLEVDLERVISMILYGLAKKNVLQVKSMEPLDVEIEDPLPAGLNEYETDFIAALREKNDKERKQKMRDSIHRLILSVSKKMDGFSLAETREYYKSICDKAWTQVEAADTPELKSKLLGDNFGWAMLQDEPENKMDDVFSGYDYYPPTWWWRVDPGYRRPVYHSEPMRDSDRGGSSEKRSGSSSSSPSTPSTPTPMPVLPGAMLARSITDNAKKFAYSLVGNTAAFKSDIKGRTNPEPVSSSSSSSHRHGGGSSSSSSSCACACACDSCACACAGGGR